MKSFLAKFPWNRTFEIKYFEQICGTVTHVDWEHSENVLNLSQGIELLFSSYRQGLIIVGGICSAIYRDVNNRFVFFDSHSHGQDGLSSVDGTAVKVIFDEIWKLLDFLFSFYHSCGISMICQFEIQSLSVKEQAAESKNSETANKSIPLIDKYFQFQETISTRCSNSSAPIVSRKKYMKNYMRKRREQSDKQRQTDRESTLKCMKKARQSKEFQEKELTVKRLNRQKTETKEKDRESTLKSKSKARQSKDFQEKELTAKRLYRQKTETKEKDRESTLKSKSKARQSKDFKEKELAAKRHYRQKTETKEKDRESTLKSMSKSRQSKDFQEKELAAKRLNRQKTETKEKDRESTFKSMSKARQSKEFQEKELAAKRHSRKNVDQMEKERLFKQKCRHKNEEKDKEINRVSKAKKRLCPEFREHEHNMKKRKCYGDTIESCIEKFHELIKTGPIYVCTCCYQTWLMKSVVKMESTNVSQKSRNMCTGLKSVKGLEWVCLTCLKALREGKTPRLSVHNGMRWPEKPQVLNLHPLEERLISQRIPFMQIRELPRGGQMSVKGNVVNVPVDIQPTVNALPRQMNEHVTIAVKLKKRLSHKSACFSENVRPNIVLRALHWLMENSEMYRSSGIKIDQTWKSTIENCDCEIVRELTGTSSNSDDRESEANDDEFCEVALDECVQGNSDTLVDEADLDTNKTYVFAPGENQRPLSLFEDKDSEYLCFPSIFCGQRRIENDERTVSVHYSDIAKWELRSVDRRAANSVPNIFFKLKKNSD